MDLPKMRRIIFILLLTSYTATAGDSPLFWRFGEMSNRILYYTEDDLILTGIPTSVFLAGLFASSLGIIGLISTFNRSSLWFRFIGLSLILGTVGAYIFSWLFDYIGTSYFDSHSVKLFWSWACSGAIIGAGLFITLSLAISNLTTKMQNKM